MQISDFNHWSLSEQNIDFYYHFTDIFKTDFIKVFIPVPLEVNTAALNALLPFVLFRGTKNFPETIDLVRGMESLYGTDLTVDVEKRGEWQIVEFGLEVVSEKYLPQGTNILTKALKLLVEIIFNPYLCNNKFSSKYVESEKRTLLEDIKNLKDDKMAYSLERCWQEMYKDEPFSIYRYGNYNEMTNIDSSLLYEYYLQFSSKAPMHVFYVGRNDSKYLLEIIAKMFPTRKRLEPSKNKISPVKSGLEKTIIEEDQINQGRLAIGYRTEIKRSSPNFPHLWLVNGVLGGFPHSRLFHHIREDKGLAYYIFSNLESTKGLLTVSAGIESDSLEETVDAVTDHLNDIKVGNISSEELNKTQKSCINQLMGVRDNGFDLIDLGMLGVLNDNVRSVDQLIGDIKKAKIDDISQAAKGIDLDTVYFLKPTEKEKNYDII